MSGFHFTGSTEVFETSWKTIGDNIQKYKTYPRIVGETGGKNFHLLHPTGDIDNFVNNTILSSFEYSGQKCSACSRAFQNHYGFKLKKNSLFYLKKLK
jgi:1-pyrroline-5-carboxylate dehydrogenase